MKKILIFSLILHFWLIGNLLKAQQWKYYNPSLSYDINSVAIPAPGVIVTGGGWETHDSVQIMFQSADYGLTWHENPNDGLAPWIKSVAFSDVSTGYGVGNDGRIITTYDAGRTWLFPATPFARHLNKIVYIDGTYYIAGGNRKSDSVQTILKSADHGYTWNLIRDTYGPWLKSIFFIDTLKGFAVGDEGVILGTTNGGNAWSTIAAPIIRDFNAITFINTDTGYIVGGSYSGQCRKTILKTVNGGLNWSILMDSSGGILKDISFADAFVGYTVGDSATVLKTTDGGSIWTSIIIDTSLTGSETFNAVKFHNANFGVIGGKAGKLYVYQDLPVEAFTMGSNQIDTTQATLLGSINTHNKIADYSFIYSANRMFSSFDITQSVHFQNNSLLLLSQHIQGLSPNTTYYYYLKAVSANDTIYGDTLTFFTGINPPIVFQTQDATNVLTWGASLNGFINNFPYPANLFFEYGDSPAFESQIAATPPAVIDSSAHYLQSGVSGLQNNNRYFFRLKGVTSSGKYYSDTKMFSTVNLPYVNNTNFQILSLTSVSLTGNVINNGLPAAIKFEYGPTPLYGYEVNALPDSAIGAGTVSASYVLTGLSPVIQYHLRIKALCANGVCYGEDRIFITGLPAAGTFPAIITGGTSAQLRGVAYANSYPTAIKFEYGPTSLYGNEVIADPDSAFGTINVNASYSLSRLSPATTYHYRIKTLNSNGAGYGDDVTFITGIPTVSTLPASNIGANSAQLNGRVNANSFPTANIFEYGTTSNYGSAINATPDSAFNTNDVNISCQLTGLLQSTTYHFRVKATNENGINYGSDMTFITGAPSVSSIPASNIGESSAQLNGIVNANNFPSAIKFEFGNSIAYGTVLSAVPDTVTGNSNIAVNYNITGLSQNTTYHFRVEASNSVGTNFGDDLEFTTGARISVFTSMATEVTSNSAKLNGAIDAGGIMTAVKFEYGTTTAYGNEISANPDSTSCTDTMNINAMLGGLMPNTTYHFRIKGSNGADTKFGEDKMFYTGQPEIPNFDFENWTPFEIVKPEGWDMAFGNISRYSPACSNNYAIKLENDTSIYPTMPGAIIIGNSSDGQGFTGGMPFNARPDTLIGCFNYSIPPNDTALAGVLLKRQGVVISFNWFEIIGSSSGNYTELKFPITYTAGGNADSLIMAFIVTDIRNFIPPQPFPTGGYLIVDHIRFTGTTENAPNSDFENWKIDTIYKPDSWHFGNNNMHNEDTNVSRTPVSQHGNYAALIRNYIYPTEIAGGWMNTNAQWQVPSFTVHARHQCLTGYYKFLPENNDTMTINAFMYKNHVFIAGGYFHATTPVTEYTPFIVPFFYDNSNIPDSCTISILSYLNKPQGNSKLYVDNLNFDGFLSGVKQPVITDAGNFDFNVYPNPFRNQASVSFTISRDEKVTVRLIDLSGKQLALLADGKYQAGNHLIDISSQGLQKGFYICVINTADRVLSKKVIIN